MTPDKLRELRYLVTRAQNAIWLKVLDEAIALIDAELAMHSTAEIAGAGAGEVCVHDWYFAADGGAARKCGKCGEVR